MSQLPSLPAKLQELYYQFATATNLGTVPAQVWSFGIQLHDTYPPDLSAQVQHVP